VFRKALGSFAKVYARTATRRLFLLPIHACFWRAGRASAPIGSCDVPSKAHNAALTGRSGVKDEPRQTIYCIDCKRLVINLRGMA